MSKVKIQVLLLKKSLEKAIEESLEKEALDILKALENISLTADCLKSTQIDSTVFNTAKKLPFSSVKALSMSIISKWKLLKNAVPIESLRPKRESKPIKHHTEKVNKNDVSSSKITIEPNFQPIPTKHTDGYYIFVDHPEFRPNLSPMDVIQYGSFGGTYFRPISSKVTGEFYKDQWNEFPVEWFEGLSIKKQVTSSNYDISVNKYKQHCGGDLEMWESSGWITSIDPYGWFQWYCRFYLGRRSTDDNRQIARGLGVMGPSGRWRNNLINKCLSSNQSPENALKNHNISPKVRQLLQHWGYELNLKDLTTGLKKQK